jgi:hypothetical protein
MTAAALGIEEVLTAPRSPWQNAYAERLSLDKDAPVSRPVAALADASLVFQRPFRIVQGVMLDPSREGGAALKDVTTLTNKGTFEYQACDDKVCFALNRSRSPGRSASNRWTANGRSHGEEKKSPSCQCRTRAAAPLRRVVESPE